MLGDSVRRRQPKRKTRTEKKGSRIGRHLLIALPIALLAPFAIGYAIAVFVLFPPTEVSGAGTPVPELTGRSVEEAQRELTGAGLRLAETMELPHPSAAAGRIVAQSPLPGQQLRPGGGVRVAVSSGRPTIVVPDVIGFSAERAEAMLRRAGFDVGSTPEQSPAPAGRIIRTDPAPGQQLTLPATVTLIVSSGLPATAPDTAAVDTLSAPSAR